MAELEHSQKPEGATGVTLSVVTATYNAASVLPGLIKSLQAQTDPDFEWVVADGGSTDGTLELLAEAAKTMRVRVDSRPDFGIYDALNRAVKLAEGDYYLVIGADDELFFDAIRKYKVACAESRADLITAKVEIDKKITSIRKYRWEWLYGQFAYVSIHAVGLVIRRNLHYTIGYYTRKLPIAADELFILEAVHSGAIVYERDFVAGRFSKGGLSGTDSLGSLIESYRARVIAGQNLIGQTFLLALRIIKNYNKLLNRKDKNF